MKSRHQIYKPVFIFFAVLFLAACAPGKSNPGRLLRVTNQLSAALWQDLPIGTEIIEQFEKKTSSRVQWQAGAEEETLLAIAAAGALAPDVIIAHSNYMPNWIEKDLMLDLAPHLKSWDNQAFLAGFKAIEGFSGRPYFLPIAADVYLTCLNKEALAYLPDGVDVQNITWKQMAQWSLAIRKEVGVGKFAVTGAPQKSLLHFAGAVTLSYGGGFPDLSSTGAQAAWALLAQMKDAFAPAVMTYDNLAAPMLAENAWIMVGHSSEVFEVYRSDPERYIVAPPPKGSFGMGSVVAAWGAGIVKDTRRHVLAAEFIEFLITPAVQADIARGFQANVPAVRSAVDFLGDDAVVMKRAAFAFENSIRAELPVSPHTSAALKAIYDGAFWTIVIDEAAIDRWFLKMAQEGIDQLSY